jgi:type II secretion system protein G
VIVVGIFAEPLRDRGHNRQIFCTIEVQRLAAALETYRADCGRYPNAREGIQSLVTDKAVKGWRGPYLKEVPLDPWGRPFLCLPQADSGAPEILPYGADGKPGGESVNADISSKNLQDPIPETPFEIRALWLMRGIWVGAWVCFVGCIWY